MTPDANSSAPLALILAAGSARRFGSDKRLARLPNGEALIAAVHRQIRAAGLMPLLVVRADDTAPLTELTPLLRVDPATAAQGMGSTLAAAAGQLLADPTLNAAAGHGVLVCLADMPWIRPATYRAVADALRPDRIVRPAYRGEPGHPVAFPPSLIPALTQLYGDTGARPLLARAGTPVHLLACADPGILQDVDHPAALVSAR